jgi:Tfp pilus assembly protein PilE
LIIVIMIIGILVAVATARYVDLRRNATDGIAKGVLGALRSQNTLMYSQRVVGRSTGSYTMRIIATNMLSTTRAMGFTWTAAATTFRMTVAGTSYTFTLTPTPQPPTTLGRITAGTGTFTTW